MNWSLRIQPGDTEIGDNTLVSVTAKLGMDIGRTGRVPRTNTLGFTTDVRRVAVGDEVALYRLQPAAQAVWTGEAHNIRNLVDRPLNVQRYRVEAQGVIAKLVSFGSGLAIAPILNVTVSDAINRLLDEGRCVDSAAEHHTYNEAAIDLVVGPDDVGVECAPDTRADGRTTLAHLRGRAGQDQLRRSRALRRGHTHYVRT